MSGFKEHRDSGAGSRACQLLQLPDDALAQVLRSLPLPERLTDSALACRTLHAAAAAATDSIYHSLHHDPPQERLAALDAWLQRHGSNLKHLDLANWQRDASSPSICLPWQVLVQLQSLKLDKLTLACDALSPTPASQQASGSNSTNPLTSLTALTDLGLVHCGVVGLGGGLSKLSALSGLRSLELRFSHPSELLPKEECAASPTGVLQGTKPHTSVSAYWKALGTTLGHLVQLTRLELHGGNRLYAHPSSLHISGFALSACRKMSNLQRLTLQRVGSKTQPLRLQYLAGSSLAALDLAGGYVDATGDWQMTSLESLTVQQVPGMAPSVLAQMPQLVHLFYSDIHESQPHHSTMQGLLQVLPELLLLEGLRLHSISGRATPSMYAALTASSSLQSLEITDCCIPDGAASHMFSARRQLPQLLQLLVACKPWDGCSGNCWQQPDAARELGAAAVAVHATPRCLVLSTHELQLLAACCPALEGISTVCLRTCPHNDSDCVSSCRSLQPLQQLASLQELTICGPWGGGAGSGPEHVLSMLTGLSQLTILHNSRFTGGSLAHLTTLTQLRRLVVKGCKTYFEDAPGTAPAHTDDDHDDAEVIDDEDWEVDNRPKDRTGRASHRKDVAVHQCCWQPGADELFVSTGGAVHCNAADRLQQILRQCCSRSLEAMRVLHQHAQQQLQEQARQLAAVQQQLSAAQKQMEEHNAQLQQWE